MKKLLLIILTGILLVCLNCNKDNSTNPTDNQKWTGTIKVNINYIGTGSVDNFHKIYIGLWYDEFSGSVDLLDDISTSSGSVTFTVEKKINFVGAFFDKDGSGSWMLTNGDVGELYHDNGFDGPGTPILKAKNQVKKLS
ncbi:MAG: hypothetical protein JW915_08720 [Chitinispirillaceae bacterium]|nr:hypothetical protein [Chitinispirillaceae bacterium]